MVTPTVTYRESKTSVSLMKTCAGGYGELVIENHTGEPILVLWPNGEVDEIPCSSNGLPKRQVLVSNLSGTNPWPHSGSVFNASASYNKTDVAVPVELLEKGPFFVRQAGIFISKTSVVDLKEYYSLDPSLSRRMGYLAAENYIVNGGGTPIIIEANTHNEDINFIYFGINGLISSTRVKHNQEESEYLTVHTNKDGRYLREEIKFDFASDDLVEVLVGGVAWAFSIKRDRLYQYLEEKRLSETRKISPTELEGMFRDKFSELNNVLDEMSKINENNKREISLLKAENSRLTKELEAANNETRKSYEQFLIDKKIESQEKAMEAEERKHQLEEEVSKLKLAAQKQTAAIESEKQLTTLTASIQSAVAAQQKLIAEQEMMRQKFRMEQEATTLKTEADKKIQEAKIRKEELSVASAEASTIGTVVKTLALVAPTVISAYLLYKSKSNAGGIVKKSITMAGHIGGFVINGVRMVSNAVISTASEICSSVWGAVKSVVSGMASLGKEVINIMSGAVGTAMDFFGF